MWKWLVDLLTPYPIYPPLKPEDEAEFQQLCDKYRKFPCRDLLVGEMNSLGQVRKNQYGLHTLRVVDKLITERMSCVQELPKPSKN